MSSIFRKRQREAQLGFTYAAILGLLALVGGALSSRARGDEPKLTAKQSASSVTVFAGKQPVASYVYADEKIARPFYAHVSTIGGVPVTRNFPPKAGEPADHADMH